jgi:hypothetical protein
VVLYRSLLSAPLPSFTHSPGTPLDSEECSPTLCRHGFGIHFLRAWDRIAKTGPPIFLTGGRPWARVASTNNTRKIALGRARDYMHGRARRMFHGSHPRSVHAAPSEEKLRDSICLSPGEGLDASRSNVFALAWASWTQFREETWH